MLRTRRITLGSGPSNRARIPSVRGRPRGLVTSGTAGPPHTYEEALRLGAIRGKGYLQIFSESLRVPGYMAAEPGGCECAAAEPASSETTPALLEEFARMS